MNKTLAGWWRDLGKKMQRWRPSACADLAPAPFSLAGVPVAPLTPYPPTPASPERDQAKRDAWFYSHHVVAPSLIVHALQAASLSSQARLLDMGCGDGIMALGVCEASGRAVVGTDLTEAFKTLPGRVAQVFGAGRPLPERLQFVRGQAGQGLPFPDDSFDGGYSWSVFEHVDGVAPLLREVLRVLKPGTPFFLQIEPLYYSAFGSHLKRLVPEPWAHLRMAPEAYLAAAAAAVDHVPPEEQDVLYRLNAFENVKRYLIGEYHSLNRITATELVQTVQQVGWQIERCELGQLPADMVPEELRPRFSLQDLCTHEIRLWLRKP
ncbi:class I SAM-dependent methyltransferase [Ideonella sp. B7]|uniref:class I SAM-dependent methyltransferase n=1 Tax=Ideonella benzenivorans TaxID=2831643 RepID=UPI001CEDCFE8|nr:class I SAM-dependent methyltransferase [Ideonella benzenivorans]MCA6218332.1 class I SAM-dependent methyltransferase [Ideonella benzenivorans]